MTDADPPKKKRKKRASPNALALAECKARGWPAMTVEQRIPHTFITRDLFNVIDIVAITPAGILGIQVTGSTGNGNHATRRNKVLAEWRMEQWTLVGGLLEVWSYSEVAPIGRKRQYKLRTERIAWADFAPLALAKVIAGESEAELDEELDAFLDTAEVVA